MNVLLPKLPSGMRVVMGTCTDETSRVPFPFLMKCFKVWLGEGMRLESLSMLLLNLVHMLQFFHLEGDEDAMSPHLVP